MAAAQSRAPDIANTWLMRVFTVVSETTSRSVAHHIVVAALTDALVLMALAMTTVRTFSLAARSRVGGALQSLKSADAQM